MYQQNYTFEALENWFLDYRPNWFSYPSTILAEAHKFYLQKKIQRLELDPNTLLIITKNGKETAYTTIEKAFRRLDVHSSLSDKALGQAIGVAGLFLLEELFEQNIHWLSTGVYPKPTKSEPVETASVSNSNTRKKNISGTRLKLLFKHDKSRLCFEVSAPNLSNFDAPDIREDFLRLVQLAHKAGFQRNEKWFECTNPEIIADFATRHLPRWKDYFFIELPESLQSLWQGGQTARLEFFERSKTKFNYRLKVSDKLLSAQETKAYLAAKSFYWSGEYGLVRVDSREKNLLETIETFDTTLTEDLPLYLLLSLFNRQKYASLDLTESLQKSLLELKNPLVNDKWEGPKFLRNYQQQGVNWLKHLLLHGCHPLLADEMGLGKTLQALALIEQLPHTNHPDLLVCPASVIGTWESQAKQFFPQINTKYISEWSSSPCTSPTIFLSTYGLIRNFVQSTPNANFRLIILDEAQSIKNPDAQTTQACFSLKATYRLALTGTPIENRFLDLWTLFRFLMPGLLGNRKNFKELTATEEGQAQLQKQVSPFILRRTKEAVAKELPEKVSTTVLCPMNETQQKYYNDWLSSKSDLKIGEWGHFFTLLLRLRQTCCDLGLLPGLDAMDILSSPKTQWLKLKLQECFSSGRKVVIFSQFKRWLERLYPMVKTIYKDTFKLFGETQNRQTVIEKFQKNPYPTAFLITLKAGGFGITLHAANTVFLLDPWWNPAVEEQAIDRLHRVGQKETVWIYRLLTQNSVEEKIQQLQAAKTHLLKNIFGKSGHGSLHEKWEELLQLLT